MKENGLHTYIYILICSCFPKGPSNDAVGVALGVPHFRRYGREALFFKTSDLVKEKSQGGVEGYRRTTLFRVVFGRICI